MTSIAYFATFEESVAIVRALTKEGLKIIVEPQLADAPEAGMFTTGDEALTSILARAPVFYIAGPFTRFDVAFSRLEEGAAKGKYTIDWLTQGPILGGLVSRINVVNGARRLLSGDFSYQDAYRNPMTNAWEKPTPEVKAAFRKIVSIVRAQCPPFEYKPGVTIYLAPAARALLEANEVHIVENQIIPGGMS